MKDKEVKVEIFYSKEDKVWIANVSNLKYCSAFGSTMAEALRELEIALQVVLEIKNSRTKRKRKPK
jgi:predicted RNase H-like HicB family nuclease